MRKWRTLQVSDLLFNVVRSRRQVGGKIGIGEDQYNEIAC